MMSNLKAGLKEERQILAVKERVYRILDKLPDDDSRRRVVAATAALHGHPICTKPEHWNC